MLLLFALKVQLVLREQLVHKDLRVMFLGSELNELVFIILSIATA